MTLVGSFCGLRESRAYWCCLDGQSCLRHCLSNLNNSSFADCGRSLDSCIGDFVLPHRYENRKLFRSPSVIDSTDPGKFGKVGAVRLAEKGRMLWALSALVIIGYFLSSEICRLVMASTSFSFMRTLSGSVRLFILQGMKILLAVSTA